MLVVGVDLRLVASMDADLDRVGVVCGASIYPFAWNILLAARYEGGVRDAREVGRAAAPIGSRLDPGIVRTSVILPTITIRS